MYLIPRKPLHYTMVYILVATGLAACTSSGQHIPVQNVLSSQTATGGSTPEGSTSGSSAPAAVQSVHQLNALQAEIRELRNQLEEQQFEVENLKQRQQDLFQGLDSRLRVSERMQQGGNTIGSDGSVTTPGLLPPLGAADQSVPVEPPVAAANVPEVAPPAAASVAASAVLATSVAGVDQQDLYDQGFEHLKRSEYTQAIDLFMQLVAQYPNGGLADDASYWIGEANYVNRQYGEAIRSFRNIVSQYPQSDRVPEALLKVGYVQYDVGDYQNAKSTFQDVLRRYPDHPVSISAKSRLQRIDQGLSG